MRGRSIFGRAIRAFWSCLSEGQEKQERSLGSLTGLKPGLYINACMR